MKIMRSLNLVFSDDFISNKRSGRLTLASFFLICLMRLILLSSS